MKQAPPVTPELDALDRLLDKAATAALRAPSILNTQPWAWRVHDGVLDLSADPDRRLLSVDPDGRMLAISCGVALHHAVVALAALGRGCTVATVADPDRPDLLARVTPTEPRPATPADLRMYQALLGRRTDRRPFGPEPVTDRQIEQLEEAAAGDGVHLHAIRPDQVTTLNVATSTAASIEIADPAYREELDHWTGPDRGGDRTEDGVPASTTVAEVPRRMPVRSFHLAGGDALDPGQGFDDGTRYLVLAGDTDDRQAWFRAGQAMSAVLLTAHDLGLGAAPMSDLFEVTTTRVALRRMMSWLCHPYIVIRVGLPTTTSPVPATPRREHDNVVTTVPRPGGPA